MNQITDPPLDYDAGLDFNYAGWTPNSHITLCQVPWDSGYKDTVHFGTRKKLETYLNGLENAYTVTGMSYMRVNAPIRLDIPFSQARRFNYLIATNGPQHGITGDKTDKFFYFVRSVRHVAPNTTEFILQLDVWQSFIYDSQVIRGYLERGHFPVVAGQTDPLWLAEPESMDLGSGYLTRSGPYFHNLFQRVDIIISSTVSLTAPPGDKDNPLKQSAKGGYVGPIPVPVETYVLSFSEFVSYFSAMSPYPWLTSGIYRVVAVPRLDSKLYERVPKANNYPPGPSGSGSYLKRFKSTDVNVDIPDWQNIPATLSTLFNNLNPAYGWFKKFQTAPFTNLYIYDGVGHDLVIDPRLLTGGEVKFYGRQSLVPGSEELRVFVANYRNNGYDDNNTALCIGSFPTLPVLNDNAAITLASQARGIAQSRESASWAQSRALAGNANSFDNTNIGINASSESARISRNQDTSSTQSAIGNMWDQTLPSAISSIGGGAAGGMTGGKGVAAVGAATAGVSALTSVWQNVLTQNQMNSQLAIRNNASMAQSNLSAGAAGGIRDNNRALADWAARGDYSQSIAAIDAKVQDAQMIPPSLQGQVGGEVAAWAMQLFNLRGTIKTISRSAIIRIGQYWSRYGYACNRFINVDNNLVLMTRMTYWKLLDVNIKTPAGMSEDYINALRGIFEKGVTVFSDPNAILDQWQMDDNRVK